MPLKAYDLNLLVDQLKITYDGIFDMQAFYQMLESWMIERVYIKVEPLNEEFETPTGKQIKLILFPFRRLGDYGYSRIRLKITVKNLTKIELEHKGLKKKMNLGNVKVKIDAFTESDHGKWWKDTPLKFFFRTLMEKYFFNKYYSNIQKEILNDTEHLYMRIKTFFNLYKVYPKGGIVKGETGP